MGRQQQLGALAAQLSGQAGARGCGEHPGDLVTGRQRSVQRVLLSVGQFVRRLDEDDAEAEDAVQSAYILAYRAMGGFRGDAKLSTWLVRIVVNESIGRARKRSRPAEVI